jgi:hypothetical protein
VVRCPVRETVPARGRDRARASPWSGPGDRATDRGPRGSRQGRRGPRPERGPTTSARRRGPVGPAGADHGLGTRVPPTPGVEEHGLGLKTLVEAQHVHDHVLRQLEMADATDDRAERRARLTFVVIGAGYTGTETAAQLQHMTQSQVDRVPAAVRRGSALGAGGQGAHGAPRARPEAGACRACVVQGRGMEVRLGTTVAEVTEDGVRLSDGTRLASRTLLWTVGVTPPPLVERLGVPVSRGPAGRGRAPAPARGGLGRRRQRRRSGPLRRVRHGLPAHRPARPARPAAGRCHRQEHRRVIARNIAADLGSAVAAATAAATSGCLPTSAARPRWHDRWGSRSPGRWPRS